MKKTHPLIQGAKWIAVGIFMTFGAGDILPYQLIANTGGISFGAKCGELEKCIKAVSELTGDKYSFDATF